MNVRVAANAPVVKVLKKAKIPFEPEVFDPKNTLVFKFPVLQGPALPADQVSLWQQAFLLTTIQREWADNSVSNTLYFRPKWKLAKHLTKWEDIQKYLKSQKYAKKTILEIKNLKDKWEDIGEFEKLVAIYDKWPIGDADHVQLRIYEYDPTHEEDIIEPVLASIAPLIKSCSLLPHAAKGVYRQMPQEGLTKEEFEKLSAQIGKMDWSEFTGSEPSNDEDKYCSGGICTVPK
jgi:hypothetical protein